MEGPPLGVRPRPEVGDGAIQQPVVVGLVQRDEVFDGVDEVTEQRELLRRRRAAVGTAASVAEGSWIQFVLGPGCLRSSQSTRGVSFSALSDLWAQPACGGPCESETRREGCVSRAQDVDISI